MAFVCQTRIGISGRPQAIPGDAPVVKEKKTQQMNNGSMLMVSLAMLIFAMNLPALAQTFSVPADVLSPPKEDGGPVVVQILFHLQDIDEIDDEAETFQFNGVMTTVWKDTRQAFDPAQTHCQEKFYQGGYQFDEISPSWFPQVVLVNDSGVFDKRAVLLRIRPDGTCILTETVCAVAEADLDLRRYPFDGQRLEAVFEVFGFDSSEIAIATEPLSLKHSEKVEIPQWILKNLEVSIRDHTVPYAGRSGNSQTFVLTMDVQRHSFFMVRLVVFPLILIVVLSWSVFWMDRSSIGDRINISFIGILTVVAYQMVVSDSLPQISYVTLMNGFLFISFIVMCAATVVNLSIGLLEKQGNFLRADKIEHLCRWIFPFVYFGLLLVITAIAFIFC